MKPLVGAGSRSPPPPGAVAHLVEPGLRRVGDSGHAELAAEAQTVPGAGPGCGVSAGDRAAKGQVGARDPSSWLRPWGSPLSQPLAAGLQVSWWGCGGWGSQQWGVRATWDGTLLLLASSALLSHLPRSGGLQIRTLLRGGLGA